MKLLSRSLIEGGGVCVYFNDDDDIFYKLFNADKKYKTYLN